MKSNILFLLVFLFLSVSLHAQTDIVPAGSGVTKISNDQFRFLEGPVWYKDTVLLFTDLSVDPAKIYEYHPDDGHFSIYLEPSDKCNGLSCDAGGNLIACQQGKDRVVEFDDQANITKVFAETYNNTPFNSPNDLIADARGGIYFTDPSFGTTPVQDKEAVYYISPEGAVTRIIDDLQKPNGVILSPDGSKLYVVDTNNKYLYSWDVAEDGSVSGKTTAGTLQTKSGSASGADGMAVDVKGNIYVASDKGVQIFSPAGSWLITLPVPEKPTNCDFGGSDLKTLYITAGKNLYFIKLNYPGYAVQYGNGQNTSAQPPAETKPALSIYPIPASGMVNYTTSFNHPFRLMIMDLSGRVISQINHAPATGSFTVAGLPNGMYFARMMSRTVKFVVRR